MDRQRVLQLQRALGLPDQPAPQTLAPQPVIQAPPSAEGQIQTKEDLDLYMSNLGRLPPSRSAAAPAAPAAPAGGERRRGASSGALYHPDSRFGVFPEDYAARLEEQTEQATADLAESKISPVQYKQRLRQLRASSAAYEKSKISPVGIQAGLMRGQFEIDRLKGAGAQRQAQVEAEHFGRLAAFRDEQAQSATDTQALIRERLAEHDAAAKDTLSRYESAVIRLENAKVDPDRAWKRKGSFAKVMAIIGSMLGAAGSALNNTPNFAAQNIRDEIDRDIAAQRAELGNKKAALAGRGRLFGMMRTHFKTDLEAELAARSVVERGLAAKVRQFGEIQKSESGKARAENLAKQLEAGARLNQQQLLHFGQQAHARRMRAQVRPRRTGVFKVEEKNVATGGNGKEYLFGSSQQAEKFRDEQKQLRKLRSMGAELLRIGKKGSRLNDSDRARVKSLTTLMLPLAGQYAGQGAQQKEEAERMMGAIGAHNELIQIGKNPIVAGEQTMSVIEGAIRRDPLAGRQIETGDHISPDTKGRGYGTRVRVARFTNSGGSRSPAPKPAKFTE